jgi:hypothetical protein
MCIRLAGLLIGSHQMPFAVPVVHWYGRKLKDHLMDCSFYLKYTLCITAKSNHMVQYPNLPSDISPVVPVIHGGDVSVIGSSKKWNYMMKMI